MVQYELKSFGDLNTGELYDLLALRIEVFSVEQKCAYQDLDYKDHSCLHFMGRDDQGRMASYCRLVPPGISYIGYSSIGRVVNSPTIRGKGEGLNMMSKAIELTHQYWPKVPIKISAQHYLKKFYESFGFIEEGQIYLEDDIPHIAMVLTNK